VLLEAAEAGGCSALVVWRSKRMGRSRRRRRERSRG
jgi:hypothetical protein